MPRNWIVTLALLSAATIAANPIQLENARPGTSAWGLASGRSAEIEGYTSLTSVNIGGTISIFVSTSGSTWDIVFYRMGYYGGAGGREVGSMSGLPGRRQPSCPPDANTGLVECNWTDPYTLRVPDDWVSGVYVGKLTANPGRQQNWILFVVRDDSRSSHLLFQSSVTTMAAYNAWGGKSLYRFNSTGAQAVTVSFDRPFGAGAGFTEFQRWEYPTVRFLEREGYDVTYCTNVDTDADGGQLLRHRAFLSVGHDEYWTMPMRSHVIEARDRGVNLAFFSSNTSYWQARLAPNARGQQNRRLISYKESALSSDPLASDGNPSNDSLVTTTFRSPPVNLPEEMFKGSMWVETNAAVHGDIVVEATGHWVFSGTGLRPGDRLRGVLGYEADGMKSSYPPQTVRLAHSPLFPGSAEFSDMTIYQALSGAYVFSTGSMEWAYGLDDYGVREVEPPPGGWINPAVQQITRNVLDRFITGRRNRAVARRR